MKLMVASYNNGAVDWNAEAEETALRSYKLDHSFDGPARCNIKLGDPTGAIAQKYNADANDVYLGVGKVTLEDPTGTDVFYGRIVRAVADSDERTVTLECRDWLDQLDDERITYDMREKLSGNIRQSVAHADNDGAFVGPAENNAGTYYFYDDNMAWAADTYNGMNLVFTTEMAGSRTWGSPPYAVSVSEPIDGIDSDNNAVDRVWVDDGVRNAQQDNDGPYTVTYTHRIYLGHNTPSDFYVHDSISGARVYITYELTGTAATATLKVYDNNAATYRVIGELTKATGDRRETFEIPSQYVPYVIDANGLASVQIYVYCDGVNNAKIAVDYLYFEIDCETTGYSSPVTINDTIATNKLEVATDLTAAATRIWEGIPYCITRTIYEHIDSAETPGDIITGGDTVVTMTCAATIEHTDGISTAQFKDKTRLEILQALAKQDKAVFWTTLGTATVNYKRTFGANTETMTDATVNSWQSLYDYKTMYNSYDMYGARIGDYEIYQQAENAASILKYLATRTKTVKSAGLVSDAEALAAGTALVARDCDIQQMISCTLAGFDSTYRLGTVVEVTSTYLNIAAVDYIVYRWTYDSEKHQTYLTLHPHSVIGLQEIDTPFTRTDKLEKRVAQIDEERYIPEPITNEVA